MLKRAATVLAWWVSIRHTAAGPLIGQCSAHVWYQAGSWVLRWVESLIAMKARLYFFATFNILTVSLFR